MKQNSRNNNKFEQDSDVSSKLFNTIRKDWHFNLRRINTNRANYLDYKQQQQLQHQIQSASKQDDLINDLIIKKENFDLNLDHHHNHTVDEFGQRLASINLINSKTHDHQQSTHSYQNKSNEIQINQFDYTNFKFDLNKSLVDQVKNSSVSTIEPIETNIDLTSEKLSFNLSKIDLKKKESSKSLPLVCVYEYLNKINSQSVPNECFHHVAQYLKQSKYINIETSTSAFKNTFFKCEYIYGENFYWIVKLKRFTNHLYQIKFVRNIQQTNTTKQLNESDLNESDLPQTPSSPTLSLNSSLNKLDDSSNRLNTFFTIDPDCKSNIFANLRPLGWSKTNGRQALKPNDFQLEPIESNENFFKLIPNNDLYEISNNLCELQSDLSVYICKIKRNVSGRILVEYLDKSQWIYYLDSRLHPLGWAKSNSLTYLNDLNLDLSEFESKANEIEPRQRHHFKLNYLMECLYQNKFYVAKVVEILNDNCFKIELDSDMIKIKITYYSNNSTSLFPCRWCAQNNFKLELPSNWNNNRDFDWDIYCADLSRKHSEQFTLATDVNLFNWSRTLFQLSEKFQLGMYLECVDPFTKLNNQDNGVICLAQIKAKLAHLIILKLVRNYSNLDEQINDDSYLIYTIDSFDLFPVGWCEFNNYYSENHIKYYNYPISLDNSIYLNMFEIRSDLSSVLTKFNAKTLWCDKLYLNINCNCGPYFLKTKLRSLPKSFGPGPICFVVSKLVQMLINKSEKPFKILKLLQASRRNLNSNQYDSTVPQIIKSKNMQRIRLKAKEKGKYLYRELEVCTQLSQLNEYLNDLCHKLKCCPRMISFTSLINNNSCNQGSNEICIDFKCCLFCTVNYFSSFAQQQTLLEQQAKAIFVKHITSQTATKEIVKKPSQIKPKQQTHSTDTISNHSPIKTRFNIRQSLLHSLKKQQEELQKTNESEREVDDYVILSKNRHSTTRDNSTEPIIKKSRKQPQQHNDIKIINDIKPSKPIVIQPTAVTLPSSIDSNIIKNNRSNEMTKSNSLISNANMSNIINCNLNNLNKNVNELSQQITSNPLHWTTDEVCKYLLENKFDPNLISLIKEHEIDGQSFLMLNLPTIQNYMNLKLGPAIKLAHLVERLKFNYFQQYQTVSNDK